MISEQPNGLVGLSLSPLAKLAHFDTTKGEQTIVVLRPCKTKCGTSSLIHPTRKGLQGLLPLCISETRLLVQRVTYVARTLLSHRQHEPYFPATVREKTVRKLRQRAFSEEI